MRPNSEIAEFLDILHYKQTVETLCEIFARRAKDFICPKMELVFSCHRELRITKVTSVTPLLMHPSYISYALSHLYEVIPFLHAVILQRKGYNALTHSPPPGWCGIHFTDDIMKCISMNEKFCISIRISLKFFTFGRCAPVARGVRM